MKLPRFIETMKPELRYGLIIGLGVSLWVLVEFLLGFPTTRTDIGEFTGYLSVIIPILALYSGLFAKRMENLSITYWQLVKAGMMMVILGALIISLFMGLYNSVIHPEWVEEGIAFERERLVEMNATIEEITAAEEVMAVVFSAEMQMIISFIGVVFEGFFLTLLIAWFVQKK